MSETDTPLEGGTDNAIPEQDDTAPTWDYYDPDEDTVEEQQEATDDDGSEESLAEDTGEAEAVEEDTDEGEQEAPDEDDGTFTLPNGESVSREEAERRFLMQEDYTRKTQDLARQRQQFSQEFKAHEESVQRLAAITSRVVEHIANMVPAKPSDSLRATDPQKWAEQFDAHERAMEVLRTLTDVSDATKQEQQQMSADQRQRLFQAEMSSLQAAFPEVAKEEGRKKFFNRVAGAAQEVGFTQAEIGQVMDHRVFKLAALAAEGLEARKAKTEAVKKVKKKAPAPAAPRRPNGQFAKHNGNAEAMRRLSQTGSIRDAMAIDFD